MAYVARAYIVMVMAYVVMTYIVMAYVAMAYIVVATGGEDEGGGAVHFIGGQEERGRGARAFARACVHTHIRVCACPPCTGA